MFDMLSREFLSILARRGRIEIIRTLRAYPERDFTINELARVASVPVMTAWRAVKDLKKVGLVKTRKIGNATSVTMTDDRARLSSIRLIPETDPQREAAKAYALQLSDNPWLQECRLFGMVGRGEHAPGEEVDVAIVYNEELIDERQAKEIASALASQVKIETNVTVVPLCIPAREMSRKGGIASELRDRETIWKR